MESIGRTFRMAVIAAVCVAALAHAVTFSTWVASGPPPLNDGQIQSISVNPSSPYVWFGEYERYAVGFVAPGGAPQTGLTDLADDPAITPADRSVQGIPGRPDGQGWFSPGYDNRIVRIGPTGTASTIAMPVDGSHPIDATVGGDGAIW